MAQSEPMKVAGLEFVTSVEQRMAFNGAARDVAMELLVKNVSDKAISISVDDVIGLSVFNAVDGVRLKPDIRRKRKPNEPRPVKLAPGESWTWHAHAKLETTNDRTTLQLRGPDGTGVPGDWFITPLKPGKLRLTIEYANSVATQDGATLWVGKATAKEAAFEIVSRDDAKRPAAVEKVGARFAAIVPDRVWKIPENRPGNSVPVSVSLQITNGTDKPLRFAGYDTLSVKLSDADGREAPRWPGPYASLRHRRPTADDFPLIAPGKSVSFPIRVELFWPTLEDRTLWLRTWHASGSPNYFYERLKPGSYKLVIVYDCQPKSYLDYPDHTSGDNRSWTGTIETTAVGVEIQAHEPGAPSGGRSGPPQSKRP
jgi:hypothetical protein